MAIAEATQEFADDQSVRRGVMAHVTGGWIEAVQSGRHTEIHATPVGPR